MPSAETLRKSLGKFESVFANASGKKSSECKAVFANYRAKLGALSKLSEWCDYTKGFSVSEQSPQVSGTAAAPALTSTVVVKIQGQPDPTTSQLTFSFSRNPDGTYQLNGW